MLIGTEEKIGEALEGKIDLKERDRIVSLVSLSLTPLRVDVVKDVRKKMDQVDIDGKAILFEKTLYAKLPEDLSVDLLLAALDVAGAPAQARRLSKPGDTVFIIGAGGKSGILCAYEAGKQVGEKGFVIGWKSARKGGSSALLVKLRYVEEECRWDRGMRSKHIDGPTSAERSPLWRFTPSCLTHLDFAVSISLLAKIA